MQNTITGLLKPKLVEVVSHNVNLSRIVIEPLERGYGHSLGNALRRVMLSSIPGCAVTEVEIEGVQHEFSTIDGVHEDVIDILLNLKQLAIILHGKDEIELTLSKSGDGIVTAADISLTHDVEIINPELVIAHMTESGILNMKLRIERNRGYIPANVRKENKADDIPVGVLLLDAAFSPINNVAYKVESTRVDQRTNLDKLKVFPNKFPSEYILVNIPDFSMDYYKNNHSILHMNAVIGRAERPTPIFSSTMTYLELNPNWNIPENLVRRDLIPTLMEQPDYMKKHNIHVFKGWGKNKEIKNFDNKKLFPYQDKSKGHIPYRFVQFPGDDNALGRIKFMFPNKYSVYLHDTDNKSLFKRRYRVYSSGCMRISKPFELLEVLKPHLRKKELKLIDKYRNSLKNKIFKFTKKLSVQTAYFTVFQRDGQTFFRKDIYQYDKFIEESKKTENSENITLY